MARTPFVERAIGRLLAVEAHAAGAEAGASRAGLLQALDPRARVAAGGLLLVASAASRDPRAIVAILAGVTLLALLSSVSVTALVLRVWLPMLALLAVIAAPAPFTTPGDVVGEFPGGLQATRQGVRAAMMLLLRVETAATISYVVVMTTTWPKLLAALRQLRVPAAAVALLSMTMRYLFLLLRAAHDMLVSRRSRAVGVLGRADERALASAMLGSLMLRSFALSRDVHDAMRARGFRGAFESLDEFRAKPVDAVALTLAVAVATLAVWSGR